MSHIGLLCPPTSGHLNPLASLGRTLQRRGHRVTMFQLPSLRARVEKEGLQFWPLDDGKTNQAELTASLQQLGRLSGLAGVRFTIACAARLAGLILNSAPEALRTAGIDLALIDQNEPAAATVAEGLNIPFISIAHLPLNREPGIPPPFVPWGYGLDWWSEARNRIGYAIADLVIAPIHAVLNQRRSEWKLTPIRTPDDSFSRLAQLCAMPKDFDFPRRHLPEFFHYVGPFLDRERPAEPFSWERLDGRPLVYASFGTVLNQGRERFEAVASACADMRLQLVLSTGGSDLSLGELPGSPIVVTRAPQLELLARAQLAITHAGLNTVLEAMHFGVPMVAIPITNDQPAVAARVQHAGLGEIVPSNRLSAHRLREAIERVLGDPAYRRRARLFQKLIAEAGGAQRAAQLIDDGLQSGFRSALRDHGRNRPVESRDQADKNTLGSQ